MQNLKVYLKVKLRKLLGTSEQDPNLCSRYKREIFPVIKSKKWKKEKMDVVSGRISNTEDSGEKNTRGGEIYLALILI